jgi:hypothetical protein
MTKHPDYVIGYKGSLEQLAKEVGNMSYDQVAKFLYKVSEDLERQAKADYKKGRKELSRELIAASTKIKIAGTRMDLAWKICEPYMPKKKEEDRG